MNRSSQFAELMWDFQCCAALNGSSQFANMTLKMLVAKINPSGRNPGSSRSVEDVYDRREASEH